MFFVNLIRVISAATRIAPAAALAALLGYLGIKHVKENFDPKPEKFDDYNPVDEYEKNKKESK
jgi:hypothetical protein